MLVVSVIVVGWVGVVVRDEGMVECNIGGGGLAWVGLGLRGGSAI